MFFPRDHRMTDAPTTKPLEFMEQKCNIDTTGTTCSVWMQIVTVILAFVIIEIHFAAYILGGPWTPEQRVARATRASNRRNASEVSRFDEELSTVSITITATVANSYHSHLTRWIYLSTTYTHTVTTQFVLATLSISLAFHIYHFFFFFF